ncbi:hypothetical protein FDUTEX481_01948 [Tolypothrix sp. PCC 7601]|nr:hypothetical protein FDUTEX481_01948 [Tolypothrix sp. PCC 7601]
MSFVICHLSFVICHLSLGNWSWVFCVGNLPSSSTSPNTTRLSVLNSKLVLGKRLRVKGFFFHFSQSPVPSPQSLIPIAPYPQRGPRVPQSLARD